MYREELLSQDQTFLKMSNLETARVDVKRASTNYDAEVRVNATSAITAFNNVTKEGVIHTIDGVLLPRTLNVTPCHLMEGLGRYSFLQAIRAAGLFNKFCNPNADSYTFFAPPDSALLPPSSSPAQKRNFDEEFKQEEKHELTNRKGGKIGFGGGRGGKGGGGSKGGASNLKLGGAYKNRNGPYYYPRWYFFYFPVDNRHYDEQQSNAEKSLTDEQRNQLASFVNSHVVQGVVAPNHLKDGMLLYTLSGLQLIVKNASVQGGGMGWAVSIYSAEVPTQPITTLKSSAVSVMGGMLDKDVVYEVSDTLISQSYYDTEDTEIGWNTIMLLFGAAVAVFGLCGVAVFFIVFLYERQSSEYTRLR